MSEQIPDPIDELARLQEAIAALEALPARILSETALAAQLAPLRARLAAPQEGGTIAQDHSRAVGSRGALTGDVEGDVITGDSNSVTHITTVYQQAPGKAELDSTAFQAALGRYLGWVEKRYGRLDLRGVERREQKALSLTLDDVYVSLAVSVNPDRQRRSRVRAAEEAQAQDIAGLLALGPRLVVTGGPGCGKTTYLHLIASTLARALRTGQISEIRESLGLDEPLPLPILIPLSAYNRYRRKCDSVNDARQGTLAAFISHHLIRQQATLDLPEDFFTRLLRGGQECLLLLDGLDEVANDRERVLVSRAVENLAFHDGIRQVVLTSRTRAYQGDAALAEEFRAAAVQPMNGEQVDALAQRRCHAVYPPDEAEAETARLQQAIRDMEVLRQARGEPPLADTPLIVTIIAIVHYNEHRLPEQRAELYEKCVDVLLAEKHHGATEANYELADWGGTLAEKRQWLAYLAYRMMSAGEEAGRSVDEATLEEWLLPRLSRRVGEAEAFTRLQEFSQAMRERGSLLDEREGLYQFTHLTFQEYLAATYLAESVRELDRILDVLLEERRLAAAWWRETILLTAGYLGLKSEEQALELINRLAAVEGDGELRLAAAELAATAFVELEGHDGALQDALATRLVSLLSARDVDVPPPLRALAGAALGRSGQRPGVTTLEPDLVPIPAGRFLMGENLDEIEIAEPFAIGRTPVTNAQFRRFWEDGGYTAKWQQCWTAGGWAWRAIGDVTEPKLLDNSGYNQPNQPVVGVSWYEAVAYANWLKENTGWPYRLPTEAEWERAARHSDGRTYPWGESWEDGIANTQEAGLRWTCAVGIFPGDRSVCGVLDLGGNVHEWCQTRWDDERGNDYPQPYRPEDGREELKGGNEFKRVIKGGGFYDNKTDWPGCAFRYRQLPLLSRGYGFRVVVSPLPTADL